jgi:hypothetical protein
MCSRQRMKRTGPGGASLLRRLHAFRRRKQVLTGLNFSFPTPVGCCTFLRRLAKFRNYICKVRNLCDSEESASCLSRKSFSSGHIVTTSNLSQSSGSWPHPSADKDKKQVSCKSRPKRLILSSRKSQTAVENCNVCGITEIACIAGGNRSGNTDSESAVRVKTNSDESVNIKDTFSQH